MLQTEAWTTLVPNRKSTYFLPQAEAQDCDHILVLVVNHGSYICLLTGTKHIFNGRNGNVDGLFLGLNFGQWSSNACPEH